MPKPKLYLVFLLALFIAPQMAYALNLAESGPKISAAKNNTPDLYGEAALRDALAKGLIKKADRADHIQFYIDEAKAYGLPDHIINQNLPDKPYIRKRTYILLSPDFVIPHGLADIDYDGGNFVFGGNVHKAGIELIVPADMPEPKGPRGFCRVANYGEFKYSAKKDLPESCKFSGLPPQLPPDAKVFAAGISGYDKTTPIDVRIDAKIENSYLRKITVNSPSAPAIIMLQGFEPGIWHFNWTKGTKILAVYVGGRYRQAVSGLPEDVPVFINKSENDESPCPNYYFSMNTVVLAQFNDLSNQLFKRDIDQVQEIKSPDVLLGGPLPENSELETAEELNVKKFKAPDLPDPAGTNYALRAALLRQAVAKGFIRISTEEDRRQYILARARAEGLSDSTIKNFIEKNIDSINYIGRDSYTILSPDFFSAEGLYNELMVGIFIAPEGIDAPRQNNNRAAVFSYEALKKLDDSKTQLDKVCKFSALPPSPEGKVYAVSGRQAKELDFQIKGSNQPASLMEIRVNSPDEPVYLLLGSANPTIWRFSWTKGSQIAAVYIDSRHKQIISGLPDDVPLLINNREEQSSTCPPLNMTIGYEQLVADNNLSKHLFNKSIDTIMALSQASDEDGVVVVGQALAPNSQLESADKWAGAEQFKNRSLPKVYKGKAGLREAEAEGLIRAATSEEIIAHKIAEAKAGGLPDHLVPQKLKFDDANRHPFYILLSPDFIGSFDSKGMTYAPIFLSPDELLQVRRNPADANNTEGSRFADEQKKADRPKINKKCKFKNLPAKGRVYAVKSDSYGSIGDRLDFQLDDSFNIARLVKVKVNSPDEPVFLMLRNGDATLWHFSWTKGTKIAAVYVSGHQKQVVSGLPANVPVISCSTVDPNQCPNVPISTNDLSRHLFNKDIYKLQSAGYIPNGLLIGQPMAEGSRLISAEELKPEKYRNLKRPKLGLAGIEESEAKGLIRKADASDIKAYMEARAKAEGLPDHIIKKGFTTDGYAITRKPYVLLSSDFIMPNYMRDNISLIVPPGLPNPESNYWLDLRSAPLLTSGRPKSQSDRHSFVYSHDDLQKKHLKEKLQPVACVFKYSPQGFPDKAKVYALGGGLGQELDFNLDGSLEPARLMKVTVNSPNAPALLILQAEKPTIWHFNWTSGTKIAGVYLSGEGPQLASGLPDGIPLLTSDQALASQCPKFKVSSSLVDLIDTNNLSKLLFARDLEGVFEAEGDEAVIGPALAKNSRLANSKKFDLANFRDASTPSAGQAGLSEAVAKGLIRKATEQDILEYKAAKSEAEIRVRTTLEKLPRHPIVKMGFGRHQDVKMPNPYVVMSPNFIIPAGLTGIDAASFIVPEGLPSPKGPIGDCLIFLYEGMAEKRQNYLESQEQRVGCIVTRDYPVSKPKFSDTCALPKPVTPDRVYAVGAYSGHKLNFQIDDSGDQAHLIKLTVNKPQESVALFLKTGQPTIWRIDWTKGTKISAVIISGGKYKQMVSGLPEGASVLSGQGDGYDLSFCPPNFDVDLGFPHKVRVLNGLSQHFFKKDIDDIERIERDASEYVIGPPLNENSQIESAEKLDLRKFNDPSKPLAGKAGLNDAVAKGLIRVATTKDMDEYLAARNKAGGLTDEAAIRAKQADSAAIVGNGKLGCGRNFAWGSGPITDTRSLYDDIYVVLSPDFVIPLSVSFPKFIVPKNMPIPKGSPGCGMIFSYDELRPVAE